MNYQRIYDRLIDRAVGRTIDTYYEVHHIIPRCLGGNDTADNLVKLTPEEHYVAHQLLAKIYSTDQRLLYAAVMMCVNRPSNKLYGWLRRKLASCNSIAQTGSGNSQFGSVWIFSLSLKENKKIKVAELQEYLTNGWERGRVQDFNNIYQVCQVCGSKFRDRIKKHTCSKICESAHKSTGRAYTGREQEFIALYKELGSMNKALKAMGFIGAVGQYYHWARSLI
jgi:hypothetical protein